MRKLLLSLVVINWLCSDSAPALEITGVQHNPAAFDPVKGEQATVRFRLSEPARVEVHFFDLRELRVRTLADGKLLRAGDHAEEWDGRDQRGKLVPPEAYHYTLVATSETGQRVEWDLTDFTSGEAVEVRDVKWDLKSGRINYYLSHAARVNVRVGLSNNGPLLRTLLDWVPRTAGPHSEPWDGMDESGVLSLAQHPALLPSVDAFALGDNVVFVLPAPSETRLVDPTPEPQLKRSAKKTTLKRMFDYGQQSFGARKDFPLELTLGGKFPKDSEGVALIDSKTSVPVQLNLPPADLARATSERFEAVFFVDGQLAFENEIAFLPMTWEWSPEGANDGIHYITGNLRGYDGHYGVATVRVRVRHGESGGKGSGS
jgi:flagellar hook assembly protein FlgD